MEGTPTAQPEDRRAVELAMRALSTRDRTVSELRTFLERKRVEPIAIDAAVAELSAAGLLDDARYARKFAEDKRELARWGAGRIERDLQKRGIDPDLIRQTLEASDQASELDNAVALLREKFEPPQDDRERDRAWRLLVRRGYEPELAYEAVRELARGPAA